MTPSPSPSLSSPSAPHLEPITPKNLGAALAVKVRPDQEFAVAPVVKSLAEAYVHGDMAWPRLIMDGDRAVGFLMAFLDTDWKEDGSGDIRSGLWRLNIAADEQGKGYGRFAVGAVSAELRARGTDRFYVTWEPGDNGPEAFYLGLGFEKTGEDAEGETVGVLKL
ncbi:GNAT family N-acetyltransferase [Streptomyces sp. NPDC046887]|uniref:GNAT family N-acetyltransferase n=1 Tax=Streptomyces sp. NPDC046887 TaxID=3155472 RepID=UPI0033D31845